MQKAREHGRSCMKVVRTRSMFYNYYNCLSGFLLCLFILSLGELIEHVLT